MQVTVREAHPRDCPVGFTTGQWGVARDVDRDSVPPGWGDDPLRHEAVWDQWLLPGTCATWQMAYREQRRGHPVPADPGKVQFRAECSSASDETWSVVVPVKVMPYAIGKLRRARRADYLHDRRYHAMVLLATFASLRWGEVTALRRSDIDLRAGSVGVRAAYIERSTGELVLGPPKSKAGRRTVGVPQAIIPVLRKPPGALRRPDAGALVFACVQGGPMRRSNFNKMSAWPHAVRAIDAEGLHFHDLRHTGNTFAEGRGVALNATFPGMREDGAVRAVALRPAA